MLIAAKTEAREQFSVAAFNTIQKVTRLGNLYQVDMDTGDIFRNDNIETELELIMKTKSSSAYCWF